ncbi:MAG: hypothetical protein ACK53X_02005, partial [Holosporales bacterium]
NPTTSGSELDSIFRNAGFGLMNGGASCLAAQSYENKPDIETVKALACGTLNPGDPTPATPTAPYYIGVKVQFVYTPLSPIGASFLGESKTVTTASIYRYQQPLTPPVCTGTGNALQFQNGAWVCVQTQNTPPNCTGAGNALQFQNGAWVCVQTQQTQNTPTNCTGQGKALQFQNGVWDCVTTVPNCASGQTPVSDGTNYVCKKGTAYLDQSTCYESFNNYCQTWDPNNFELMRGVGKDSNGNLKAVCCSISFRWE